MQPGVRSQQRCEIVWALCMVRVRVRVRVRIRVKVRIRASKP